MNNSDKVIACGYCNIEKYPQIIRIANSYVGYLEKSVPPNQCVYFNAPEDALLEVHGGNLMTIIHEDTIPCVQLKVANNIDSFVRKDIKVSALSRAA